MSEFLEAFRQDLALKGHDGTNECKREAAPETGAA